MKKNTAFFFLWVLFLAGPVQAQEVFSGDFSADIVSQSAEGSMRMKLYSAADKSRMEMGPQTMIIRRDLGVMWILMPDQQMYMEQGIDLRMASQTALKHPGEVERVVMGTEQINGKTAEKTHVTYVENGVRSSVYQWLTAEGLPVRVQAEDGSWTVDFENISTAKQGPALFEIPQGFQKLAIPSMNGGVPMLPMDAEQN